MNYKKIFFTVFYLLTSAACFSQQPSLTSYEKEWPTASEAIINIKTLYRKLRIEPWDQEKVKLVLTITKPTKNINLINWEKDFSVSVKASLTSFEIESTIQDDKLKQKIFDEILKGEKSHLANGAVINKLTQNPNIFSGLGNSFQTLMQNIGTLTIYIPKNASINLNATYAITEISGLISHANVELRKATLNAGDFSTLHLLNSTYSTIYCNKIKKAVMSLHYCIFNAKEIRDITIDSKFSKIEYSKGQVLELQSKDDTYDIGEIDSVFGTKRFNSFQIQKLNNYLDLKGESIDLKIREINSAANLVDLKSENASISLNTTQLADLSIDFTGKLSRIFAPFKVITFSPYQQAQNLELNGIVPDKFKAHFGNPNFSKTKFILNCNSCNINFR